MTYINDALSFYSELRARFMKLLTEEGILGEQVAVSYTHLDVYKRQVIQGIIFHKAIFLYNGVHLSIHMHPLQRTGMSRQARVSCS